MNIPLSVNELIKHAIQEDIGNGDITSKLLVAEGNESKALYIAKGSFVMAGFPFAKEVFVILDSSVKFETFYDEGAKVRKGDVLAEVSGKTRILLAGERVSLNILQRLSGIATLTSRFVDIVQHTKAEIYDTRKTTPCHRFMEKYAVRMGGGKNHRFGLFDEILIKDNHIEAVGSIKEAIDIARAVKSKKKIEVEVENLKDLKEAVEARADIVMLDNMSVADIRKSVKIVKGRTKTEASGKVNLKNVKDIAETGVDMISVGSLTHSAPAADISMKIVK